MKKSDIKVYKKIGEPTVLGNKYGKKLISQMFENPVSQQEEEFILFGQKDWSVIFALTEDKKVLVVRQYKQGCDKIIEELPAGVANFDEEKPEEIIQRELEEETGYKADETVFLGSYWIASRSSWTRFHCFFAQNCKKVGEPTITVDEQTELDLVPLEEWVQKVMSGEIDEPSAAIATYASLFKNGLAKLTI